MLKEISAELGLGTVRGREKPMATHIPYTRHLSDNVIGLSNGNLAVVLKMDGLFFQTLDQATLNMRAGVQNVMLRSLGSSRYTLWSTIIRREVSPHIGGEFTNEFTAQLDRRYMAGLSAKRTFVNDLYLTIVRSDLDGPLGFTEQLGKLSRLLGGKAEEEHHARSLVAEITEILDNVVSDFSAYGCRALGIRRDDKNDPYSEPCEFFDSILNLTTPRKLRLPRMAIKNYVGQNRLHFAKRKIQMQGAVPQDNRFGAMLSIKEYPPFTGPGLLDGLLQVNHEFILTQSFQIADKPIAQERISRLQRQIGNSDEAGTSVEDDIHLALNSLVNQEAVFGYHHLTLMPVTRSPETLDKAVSELGTSLTDMNINWLREDLSLEAAFWAQLPGNFGYIARKSLLSSANFSGFSSLHNFATGQLENLHWETPVSVLETTSQTPYYFNFHQRDVGHFTVTGPTGSGKTVAMTFLLAQAFRVRPEPRAVFFDKDRGAEIFIRAIGGAYEVLDPDVPSGFNPLQIENTEANREFLSRLLKTMLRRSQTDQFTQQEEQIITDALVRLMKEPIETRTLRNFHYLFQGSARADDNDLFSRLRPWVDGHKSWLFNAERDALNLSAQNVFGFDMTSILDNDEVRTPALMYLFHRLDELLTGDPLMIFMDEGWKLLTDPMFASYITDKLKTIRKMNGIVGFGTQSAADITKSAQAHTLIEQSSVNIHFPNARADKESYMERFGLTLKEFDVVKKTPPESRRFLIKRGNESVVAKLDLSGMPDLIKVLSGGKETVMELDQLCAQHGDDPKIWLPLFCGWKTDA